MKNKLLYKILIGLGSLLLLFFFPLGMILSLAFWVYLGVMFLKKKRIFHEGIEPQLAKKQLKRLKILSIVSGISIIIAFVGLVMHNIQSSISETHEFLYFFIGLIPLYIFILISIISFVIVLKSRQNPK
ncbi:MAG: hypothetical protein ABFR32_13470 [Bacteroidota bacterium]